jgi:hypothetical protein
VGAAARERESREPEDPGAEHDEQLHSI